MNWLNVYGGFYAFLHIFEDQGYSDATIRRLWSKIPGTPPLDGPELGIG